MIRWLLCTFLHAILLSGFYCTMWGRPWTLASANAPNPLGISFAPTHVSAAEVDAKGNHFLPVARIDCGDEYKHGYLQTLQDDYEPGDFSTRFADEAILEDHTISTDVITSVLRRLKKSMEEKLHRSVDDATITVPAHFNKNSVLKVASAAKAAGFLLQYPQGRIIPFRMALHSAYQLDKCTAVGHAQSCDTYDGHLVLSIDYNATSLSLSIMEATEDMSEIFNHSINVIAEDLDQSAQIIESINNILSKGTSSVESRQGLEPSKWKPLKSDIRAIVLSGEASPEGFDYLRTLLRENFADLGDVIKDDIDPAYVLAFGAARVARTVIEMEGNRGTVWAGHNADDFVEGNDDSGEQAQKTSGHEEL